MDNSFFKSRVRGETGGWQVLEKGNDSINIAE
jgi:hypothetical protein